MFLKVQKVLEHTLDHLKKINTLKILKITLTV
jgi:hypothetical protein